eukprot:366980_1
MDEIRPLQLASVILCTCTVLIVLFICLAHYHLFDINYYIPLKIKCCTHFTNILGLIGSTCILALMCNVYFNSQPFNTPTNYLIITGAGICSNFGLQLSSYIIYLLRINYTFKDSVWQIEHRTFAVIITLFTIYALIMCYIHYQLLLLSSIGFDNITENDVREPIKRANEFSQIVSSACYILLLYIFCSRLFKIINLMKCSMDVRQMSYKSYKNYEQEIELSDHTQKSNVTFVSMHDDRRNNQNETTALKILPRTLNMKQQHLMHVVTRTTVLITVSIFASAALNILFIFVYWRDYDIIVRTFQCIYCLIEVLCLFMNYKSNEKIYNKLCCGCNKCFNCCCIWINWWCSNEKH